MKDCFSVKFLGYEIIIPKKDVKFSGDFGLVTVSFDVEGVYQGQLIGIVDHDFNEIISLFPREQLVTMQLFSHDILFLIDKGVTRRHYRMYQLYKENENIIWKPLPFLNFQYVNDNICKVWLIQNGDIALALYDVINKKIISNLFSYIGDFYYHEGFNQVVAEAGYHIFYNESNYNKLMTYINLEGKVVSPYFDCDQNKFYDFNEDFQSILDDVKENMKGWGRL